MKLFEKQLSEIIKEFLSNEKTFLVLKEHTHGICELILPKDVKNCCPEEILIERSECRMFVMQHQFDSFKNEIYAPYFDKSIEYLKQFSEAKLIGILSFYESGKKSENYADFMSNLIDILKERMHSRKKTIITTFHSLESIGNISKKAHYLLSPDKADWYQVGRIKIEPEIFKI